VFGTGKPFQLSVMKRSSLLGRSVSYDRNGSVVVNMVPVEVQCRENRRSEMELEDVCVRVSSNLLGFHLNFDVTSQGSLTEGEGSGQLTSLHSLVQIS